jgi:hypothetical protein
MSITRFSEVQCSVHASSIQKLTIFLPGCNSHDPQELASLAVCRNRAVNALRVTSGATENELLETRLYMNHCLSKAAAIRPFAYPTNDQLSAQIESVKSEMALMKGDIKDLIRKIASMGADIKFLINQTNQSNKIVDGRLAAIEARQRNAAAVDGADTL